MKKVWKYQFPAKPGETDFWIPKEGEFLSIKEQRGKPVMWFLVDPEHDAEKRTFLSVMTGEGIPDREYIFPKGSVLLHDQNFVLHIFEVFE